jgi:hypothetical protein
MYRSQLHLFLMAGRSFFLFFDLVDRLTFFRNNHTMMMMMTTTTQRKQSPLRVNRTLTRNCWIIINQSEKEISEYYLLLLRARFTVRLTAVQGTRHKPISM